jgi:hypothetical protein
VWWWYDLFSGNPAGKAGQVIISKMMKAISQVGIKRLPLRGHTLYGVLQKP